MARSLKKERFADEKLTEKSGSYERCRCAINQL